MGFCRLQRSHLKVQNLGPRGGCTALFCGLLHIPHILYTQLRRNNQGSKQGHSRTAVPHTARITCVGAESLHRARQEDLRPEDSAGRRKQASRASRPSVLHKTEVVKKRRVRDQERQRAEGARPELREGRRPQLDFLSMPLPH